MCIYATPLISVIKYIPLLLFKKYAIYCTVSRSLGIATHCYILCLFVCSHICLGRCTCMCTTIHVPIQSCFFKCDPRFFLIGSMDLVCFANGSWSRSSPTCYLPNCGNLVSAEEHISIKQQTRIIQNVPVGFCCQDFLHQLLT